ncbi:MAG TPA: accessory Sec system translocase SecA2 [Terriglobia bacterium]|nr:accessory Sec system translocase SecA2 [Terriglobia bacterium]
MRRLFQYWFDRSKSIKAAVRKIRECCTSLAETSDERLKATFRHSRDLIETTAVVAIVVARVLGISMFDVQLHGAVAMANGKIAEMQTGEGKTVAAVPAVAWYAKQGRGVHVLTANDYLSRRDAEWMGPIYRRLGLTVGCIQQGMTASERKNAYACDVTYSTANEVGFDYLRDQMALYPQDQVHRPFAIALVDEVDSILIDEARIPLVIAGGSTDQTKVAYRADFEARRLRVREHFLIDDYGRNISLTDAGIAVLERNLQCENLFLERNGDLLRAIQDSLHAHHLLRRDVDYLVKNGAIESIDEFKGRIAQDRRWPGGLHTAIEAKEGVDPKRQGRVLGSITVQNLISLYETVCGMTGTAASQADEFKEIYDLRVDVIPTNRPMIRVDHPDAVFETRAEKERALLAEIEKIHGTSQPVLVGTASVEESERLSERLRASDIPHTVLNARNDEEEAAIIARAGERGAVTISTNMAGRGTDIRLGDGVTELGGLYVIGTNRQESRRIDNQLRGRAGRQGDPGASKFFVSLEDPLFVKYAVENERLHHDPEGVQRIIEGQNLDIRKFLNKYERMLEGQRFCIQERRQQILDGTAACSTELERLISLTTIDDLWAEYLAGNKEIRDGIQWISLGSGNPFNVYLRLVHASFQELQSAIDEEIPRRLQDVEARGLDPRDRGATWTYLTTDQPFGTWWQRIVRGMIRKARGKSTSD